MSDRTSHEIETLTIRIPIRLQLAHSCVAAAIAERSRVLSDPIGRFQRTFGIVFVLVFGTLDRASAATRRLDQLHGAIQEILPSAAGPFAAGSQYHANDVGALRWVHATLVGTSLALYEAAGPCRLKFRFTGASGRRSLRRNFTKMEAHHGDCTV
jgi:uncharacterized protein (DUF2236 family)